MDLVVLVFELVPVLHFVENRVGSIADGPLIRIEDVVYVTKRVTCRQLRCLHDDSCLPYGAVFD